jgi:tRNA(Ile)-lysidine synthase
LLDRLGIASQIVAWTGAKPQTGLAEAARIERYRLLQQACTEAGILHLLLAHQRNDQAETVLMRLGDGSGLDGLAGMASVRELDQVRLLRPLLDVPRARLTATLRARGIGWVDDPSNTNLRYLRPRLRQDMMPKTVEASAALAERFAAERAAIERRLAAIAVDCVSLHEAGWASLDRAAVARLPERLRARLLGQLVFTLGGGAYRPRQAAILRAMAALSEVRGATAGGCRLVPRSDRVLVAREAGAIGHAITLPQGDGQGRLRWDNRFDLELDRQGHGCVAALGEAGRLEVLHSPRFAGPVRQYLAHLPAMAAASLPALWSDPPGAKGRPFLGVGGDWRSGRPGGGPATVTTLQSGRFVAGFRPGQSLAAAPHALVLAGQRLI